MYGEHVLADWIFHHVSTFAGAGSWAASHTLATILSVAFLTYLHIVLGEMIPKSLALQSAERTVLWITPVMRTINLAVYPLVIALNAVGNLMLRLVGINRAEGSSDHHYSPEELALIVDESEEGGQLRAEAGQMLRELFAFSDTSAREAMVPRVRVTGIEIGSAPEDVRRTAMVSGPHALPGVRRRPRSHRRLHPHQGAGGARRRRARRSPAATRTRSRRCRTPRRSTTCWPRSAATPRRWRWSSTSTAAPPA